MNGNLSLQHHWLRILKNCMRYWNVNSVTDTILDGKAVRKENIESCDLKRQEIHYFRNR
jgi:hypothetical protein